MIRRRAAAGCRRSSATLFDVRRVGDVPGFEIPSRFFQFMRTGDPRPLEPVLEHNRLDLVSLAAVTARAVRLVEDGADGCPDEPQALAVGRIYERAGLFDRAEACYRRAATSDSVEVEGERACIGSACGAGATAGSYEAAGALARDRRVDRTSVPRGATPLRPRSGSLPSKRWRSITSTASAIWRWRVNWRCSRCRKGRRKGETAVERTVIVIGSRG